MITPELITDLMLSDKYQRCLAMTVNLALEKQVEVAFASYNNRIIPNSDPLWSEPEDHDYEDAVSAMYAKQDSIDVLPLVTSEYTGGWRKDVIAMMHTHEALTPKEVHWDRPSIGDLASHEQIALCNPGLVDGIAVIGRHLAVAGLFLYRHADTSRPNMYQAFETDPSKCELLDTMQKSGFKFTSLEFDPKIGTYTQSHDGVADAVKSLF